MPQMRKITVHIKCIYIDFNGILAENLARKYMKVGIALLSCCAILKKQAWEDCLQYFCVFTDLECEYMQFEADGKTNGPGIRWPGGARVAVMLTFDFDAEFLRISRAESKGTKIGFTDQSRGEYGPHTGLARCLQVLENHGVKATFFVPGAVVERYPNQVKRIHAAGHELAAHGYLHESRRGISEEEEQAILEKSEALLESVTGKKPVGHRGPESIIHPFTPKLLRQRGYLYSSSMKDRDWAYLWPQDETGRALVELPGDVMLDDFTYYYFTFSDPAVRSMYPNRQVLADWCAELDALAQEGDKIFVLKLHPQMIGRSSRAAMLGDFIAHAKSRGAWIATCEEVARHVLEWEGGDA